jgi:hypothetical protein
MATRYADRAFISLNGVRLADVQSASLKQDHTRRVVPSMTQDGFNRGFVQGNRNIDIDLTVAVQNQLGRPKLETIDYEANDVQLTFIVGADSYTATGLFLKTNDDNSGGVGDEVKATFSFAALRLTDNVGNSVLFNIGL